MDGYEWDGRRWVPQARQPGMGWAPPAETRAPTSASYPALPGGGFTEPRYGYGLTRQASDDIQFIARYMRIMIFLGLILIGVTIILQLAALASVFGFVTSVAHR